MRTTTTTLLLSVHLASAFGQGCDSVNTLYDHTYQNHGAMFNVTASLPVTLDHLTANLRNITGTFNIYSVAGGFEGHEGAAGDWTLIGSASVTSNNTTTNTDLPTVVPIDLAIDLAAGETIGLYLMSMPTSMVYFTTVSGSPGWGTPYASDAYITVSWARGIFQSFGTPFASSQVWNGSVGYCPNTMAVEEQQAQEFSLVADGGRVCVVLDPSVLAAHDSMSLLVLDASGRTLLRRSINGATAELGTASLAAGAYVVMLQDQHGPVRSLKFLVQ